MAAGERAVPGEGERVGRRQTRNSWMCASRRVARIAAQPSTGKTRNATARRVSGQNTASVTTSISTRWTISSTARRRRRDGPSGRITSGSTASWAVSAARNDISPAIGASSGPETDGDRRGAREPAQQRRDGRDGVVAHAVDLVERRSRRSSAGAAVRAEQRGQDHREAAQQATQRQRDVVAEAQRQVTTTIWTANTIQRSSRPATRNRATANPSGGPAAVRGGLEPRRCESGMRDQDEQQRTLQPRPVDMAAPRGSPG